MLRGFVLVYNDRVTSSLDINMSESLPASESLSHLVLPSSLSHPATSTQGDVLREIASAGGASKASLVVATGASRTAITNVVSSLMRRGLVTIDGWIPAEHGRGRPAERLVVAPGAGFVGAIDSGATSVHVAVCSLDQGRLISAHLPWDVRVGPEPTLDFYATTLERLAQDVGVCLSDLHHVVLGLPARLEVSTQRPVRPAIMPGWDGYPVSTRFRSLIGTTVTLENDANLRALGEACAAPNDLLPVLTLKIGTGIGAGLVDTYGHVFHGFRGAAGEIGHIAVSGASDHVCGCGRVGCLEANASIPAMLRNLEARRGSALPQGATPADTLVAGLVPTSPEGIAVVRQAAEQIGDVVAILLDVLNPRRVIIDCPISTVSDRFLASIRSRAYEKARPLSTRDVLIAYGTLGESSGIAGAVALAIDYSCTKLTSP